MADITETVIEDARWEEADLAGLTAAAARATLHHLGMQADGYELAVLGADDARIAVLNADFRGKPQPTNVLSWPSEERGAEVEGDAPEMPPPGNAEEPEFLGDLALAWETCAREASEAGRPFDHHVTHLVVHGILHLLGYDHERDGDAALMERIEVETLASLGIPTPY
jgi:probable rRNA maturation factor